MEPDILTAIREAFDAPGVAVVKKNMALRKASDEIVRLRAEIAELKKRDFIIGSSSNSFM
jgi:hypothetical protein